MKIIYLYYELDCGWCHPDAECLRDEETRQPYCRCKPDFVGDGINACERENGCNVLNNCSPYASCIYDQFSWRCICNAVCS
jgi:nidogen (entactin)